MPVQWTDGRTGLFEYVNRGGGGRRPLRSLYPPVKMDGKAPKMAIATEKGSLEVFVFEK